MTTRSLFAVVLLSAAVARAASDFDGRPGGGPPLETISPPTTPAAEPGSWVVLEAGDSAARTKAATAGVSLEEFSPGRASGFATPEAVARAQAAGLKVLFFGPIPEGLRPKKFPIEDSPYHDFAETVAELQSLANQAPDLASVFPIGETTLRRKIWALRLCADAKGQAPSRKPGILLTGMHHAREHLSNEVPLLLAGRLIARRSDPKVARLLALRDIYVIPMVNPDGGEYDISTTTYRLHRKNMRDNGDGSFGVDLNRNYDWRWGGIGSSPHPRDDTYHGPSPFSEPETRAVKAFIESRANLTTLVSYHTYSELILYPWGGSNDPIEDVEALEAYKLMAEAMGGMTDYTPMQSSDLYVATGDLTDWTWATRGIFSWTFELTPRSSWDGGFYPGPGAIASTVEANWKPLLYLVDLADDPRRVARTSSHARSPRSP